MRTDAKISNRKVYLPRASTIGYGKYEAKRGDLIVYEEHDNDGGVHNRRMARVLGTVDAPGVCGNPPTKNHLFVLALADDGHTAYERWIDPKRVVSCQASPSKFAAWFFSDEPMRYSAADVIRLSEYGTLDDHYIDKLDARVQQLNIKRK